MTYNNNLAYNWVQNIEFLLGKYEVLLAIEMIDENEISESGQDRLNTIYESIFDSFWIGMARLVDNEEVCGNKTFNISYVHRELALYGIYVFDCMYTKVTRCRQALMDVRNNILAHNNREIFENSQTMRVFNRDYRGEFVYNMITYTNLIIEWNPYILPMAAYRKSYLAVRNVDLANFLQILK